MLGGTPELQYGCSRAGCAAEAAWVLRWRNPKIHDEDRRKTWLACDGHRDYLKDFLEARSFPLEMLTLGDFTTSTAPHERDE